MPYVTQEYYNDTFHGEPVDNADFPSLSERAAEIVEEMCMYRISESNLNKYCSDTQERIKKAVCAQIEYLDANGGSEMDNGTDLQSAGLESLTIQSPRGQRGVQNNPFIRPVHNAY